MIYKVRSGKTCISTWKDQIKSQTHTWKTPLSNKITHKDTFATIVNTDWDTFTGWQRTQAIHTLSVVNLEKPEMGSMAKALFGYFQVDFRQLSSSVQFSSVQFSCSVVSNSLRPHGPQHARPPCPSPTPGVHPNPCPLSWWCHPTISSSVIPSSSWLQSFPAPGSFQMSQLFAWGGQSTGFSASASVLPMNIQDWSPLRWTSWVSLQSKGLSRVFSYTIFQKHQFFGTQLSL